MTMEEAITEAHEYFNNYAEIALKHDGKYLKVRVVELEKDVYAWHDYTEGTFARTTWRDRPTLMIIE